MKKPRLLKVLENRDSEFVELIKRISRKVEPIIDQRIIKIFSTYTLHDSDHSLRIMDYMFDLIPDVEKISDLDITILILSALLHDTGMAVEDDEINEIIEGKYTVPNLSYFAVLRKHQNNKDEALREYIRKIHGTRSHDFITQKLTDDLKIPSQPGTSIANDIAKVSKSHTEDISWLHKNLKVYNEKASYSYSPLFCAVLLRIADILDIDSQRTPPFLMSLISMNEISNEEWKQHMVIYNLDKVKNDEFTGGKTISIFGECRDASLHRKLLSYLDWINSEIKNSNDVDKRLSDNYKLKMKYPLINNVESIGYSISDIRLSIDFKAITNLLMGEKIYGSKIYGLRELIQNSIDACKVREEIEISRDEYGENDYKPSIKVILDKQNNDFIVKDNGIGMDFDILKNYFLNVGVSYYKSDDFLLRGHMYNPIGNFGIGFLACFMLSDQVELKTKSLDDVESYKLTLVKNSPFITLNEEENPSFTGTEIKLKYDEVIFLFNNDVSHIKRFLSNQFLTDSFELELLIKGEEKNKINNRIIDIKNGYNEQTFMDLSNYLIGIEGHVNVDVSKNIHGESIVDIPVQGDLFYYDGVELVEVDERFNLEKIYNENNFSIEYLEIPIIGKYDSERFYHINEVLDDLEETIEKMEDELRWITIFLNGEIKCEIEEQTEIKAFEYIIGNLKFEDLFKFGQLEEIPTLIFRRTYDMYFSNTEKIFLNFRKKHYDYYIFNRPEQSIFIKNILVSDTKFSPLNILSFVKIQEYKINIVNPKIFPEVSRNKIDKNSDKMLQYALNKSICLWVMDNIELTEKQRRILNDYIKVFYYEDNELIKRRMV